MEVNYKKKKYYNTAKYPIRQPKIMTFLLFIVSKVALMFGVKYKIKKINMEGLKPPYILLSNHHYFIDFELSAIATFPHRVNNVATVESVQAVLLCPMAVSVSSHLHSQWQLYFPCFPVRKQIWQAYSAGAVIPIIFQ